MAGKKERAGTGQAVVEFALTSLLLLTMIFGTIDLGRAVFDKSMLSNATREAARYGMVNSAQIAGAGDLTAFQTGAADAAARRSPSLGLTTTNFPTSEIICAVPGSSDFTTPCTNQYLEQNIGPGWRLRLCSTYTFRFAAARLIRIGTIPMSECSTVTIQ